MDTGEMDQKCDQDGSKMQPPEAPKMQSSSEPPTSSKASSMLQNVPQPKAAIVPLVPPIVSIPKAATVPLMAPKAISKSGGVNNVENNLSNPMKEGIKAPVFAQPHPAQSMFAQPHPGQSMSVQPQQGHALFAQPHSGQGSFAQPHSGQSMFGEPPGQSSGQQMMMMQQQLMQQQQMRTGLSKLHQQIGGDQMMHKGAYPKKGSYEQIQGGAYPKKGSQDGIIFPKLVWQPSSRMMVHPLMVEKGCLDPYVTMKPEDRRQQLSMLFLDVVGISMLDMLLSPEAMELRKSGCDGKGDHSSTKDSTNSQRTEPSQLIHKLLGSAFFAAIEDFVPFWHHKKGAKDGKGKDRKGKDGFQPLHHGLQQFPEKLVEEFERSKTPIIYEKHMHRKYSGISYYYQPQMKESSWFLPDLEESVRKMKRHNPKFGGQDNAFSSSYHTPSSVMCDDDVSTQTQDRYRIEIVDKTPNTGEPEDWATVTVKSTDRCSSAAGTFGGVGNKTVMQTDWLRVKTTTGLIYFHNKLNGATSWECPASIADAVREMEEKEKEDVENDLDQFVIPDGLNSDSDEDEEKQIPQREDEEENDFQHVIKINSEGSINHITSGKRVGDEKEEFGKGIDANVSDIVSSSKKKDAVKKTGIDAIGTLDSSSDSNSGSGDSSDSEEAKKKNPQLKLYHDFKELISDLDLTNPQISKSMAPKLVYTSNLSKLLGEKRFLAIPAKERPALFEIMFNKVRTEKTKKQVEEKNKTIENFKSGLRKNKDLSDQIKTLSIAEMKYIQQSTGRDTTGMRNTKDILISVRTMQLAYRAVERQWERDDKWKKLSREERERLISDFIIELSQDSGEKLAELKKQFTDRIEGWCKGFLKVQIAQIKSSKAALENNRGNGTTHGGHTNQAPTLEFPPFSRVMRDLRQEGLSNAECESIYIQITRKRLTESVRNNAELLRDQTKESLKRKREIENFQEELEVHKRKRQRLELHESLGIKFTEKIVDPFRYSLSTKCHYPSLDAILSAFNINFKEEKRKILEERERIRSSETKSSETKSVAVEEKSRLEKDGSNPDIEMKSGTNPESNSDVEMKDAENKDDSKNDSKDIKMKNEDKIEGDEKEIRKEINDYFSDDEERNEEERNVRKGNEKIISRNASLKLQLVRSLVFPRMFPAYFPSGGKNEKPKGDFLSTVNEKDLLNELEKIFSDFKTEQFDRRKKYLFSYLRKNFGASIPMFVRNTPSGTSKKVNFVEMITKKEDKQGKDISLKDHPLNWLWVLQGDHIKEQDRRNKNAEELGEEESSLEQSLLEQMLADYRKEVVLPELETLFKDYLRSSTVFRLFEDVIEQEKASTLLQDINTVEFERLLARIERMDDRNTAKSNNSGAHNNGANNAEINNGANNAGAENDTIMSESIFRRISRTDSSRRNAIMKEFLRAMLEKRITAAEDIEKRDEISLPSFKTMDEIQKDAREKRVESTKAMRRGK